MMNQYPGPLSNQNRGKQHSLVFRYACVHAGGEPLHRSVAVQVASMQWTRFFFSKIKQDGTTNDNPFFQVLDSRASDFNCARSYILGALQRERRLQKFLVSNVDTINPVELCGHFTIPILPWCYVSSVSNGPIRPSGRGDTYGRREPPSEPIKRFVEESHLLLLLLPQHISCL